MKHSGFHLPCGACFLLGNNGPTYLRTTDLRPPNRSRRTEDMQPQFLVANVFKARAAVPWCEGSRDGRASDRGTGQSL